MLGRAFEIERGRQRSTRFPARNAWVSRTRTRLGMSSTCPIVGFRPAFKEALLGAGLNQLGTSARNAEKFLDHSVEPAKLGAASHRPTPVAAHGHRHAPARWLDTTSRPGLICRDTVFACGGTLRLADGFQRLCSQGSFALARL